jgi:hypothetical protein
MSFLSNLFGHSKTISETENVKFNLADWYLNTLPVSQFHEYHNSIEVDIESKKLIPWRDVKNKMPNLVMAIENPRDISSFGMAIYNATANILNNEKLAGWHFKNEFNFINAQDPFSREKAVQVKLLDISNSIYATTIAARKVAECINVSKDVPIEYLKLLNFDFDKLPSKYLEFYNNEVVSELRGGGVIDHYFEKFNRLTKALKQNINEVQSLLSNIIGSNQKF